MALSGPRVFEVTLGVGVITQEGMFVPGLKAQNFRVLEDNVPQTIDTFSQTQGPITAVLLTESFNNDKLYPFSHDALIEAYTFAQTLKKDDQITLITYDVTDHVVRDFTQNKSEIMSSINALQRGNTASAETNLFDALYDTLDRLNSVGGRKYIVLVSSGRDTSSKHTVDQLLQKVKASNDTAIYSIGTGQALRNYAESHGAAELLCPKNDLKCVTKWAQADKQMSAFAKTTGGKFYRPLSAASFRDAFVDIGNTIRNQYIISYHPRNRAEGVSYRKIKVELVDGNGQPLKMRNERGKEVKYQINARDGYQVVAVR
jgi:VWFA-related protein